MGHFLGRSDYNALIVGITCDILNNAVSSRFHCVYDNHFSTAISCCNADSIPLLPDLPKLFWLSGYNHYNPEDVIQQRERQIFDVHRINRDVNEPSSVPAHSTPSWGVCLDNQVPTVTAPPTSGM